MADLGQSLLDYLKRKEGYVPKAKWDYRQYSGGYGTRAAPGEIFTPETAEARLRQEAGTVDSWLGQNVKAPLTEQQRTGLTSFGFNLGTDDLGRLLPDINAGNWPRVAERMRSFNRAGGQVLPALTQRRAEEAGMVLGKQIGEGGTMQPQPMPVAGTTGTMAGLPDFGTLPSARKRKMAEALMTNYRDQLARTTNPLGAISAIVQAGVGTHLGDQYDTEEKTYKRKLAEALMGAKTDDDLQRTLFASGDDDLVKAATSARIAAMKPQEPIEVGGNLVQKGPGGYQTVYSAPPRPVEPTERERLAKAAGLQPGTPDYNEFLLKGPKAGQAALTATDKKEIFEADDTAQAAGNVVGALNEALELNDQAYYGLGAQTRGYLTSIVGSQGGKATEELQNLVTTQVLDSLKATFGAAPTEGERQILEAVQGSVSKAPDVRKRIYERAIVAAKKRQKFNAEKGQGLRTGKYYEPGYQTEMPQAAPPPPPAAGGASAPQQEGAAPAATPSRVPGGLAIEKLLRQPTPEMQAFFDEKYGPGMAARILQQRQTSAPTPAELPETAVGGGLY